MILLRTQGVQVNKLRTGYTTGTYAAALTLAAWLLLRKKQSKRNLTVQFPDQNFRSLEITQVSKLDAYTTQAWACKDGGDDPDVTNGIPITITVSDVEKNMHDPRDFVTTRKQSQIIIHGGQGVGLVTRKGLDVKPGKWAINPVPRKMIVDNLVQNGFGQQVESIKITIAFDQGERLSQKTLNPILGITGGLSVLGTSGIVYPCSHEAYIATIELLLKGAKQTDEQMVALVTGGRTHRWLAKERPDLPEPVIIRIGDFIQQALTYAARQMIPHIVVACMPGKLTKYALGHKNTHAHKSALEMSRLGSFLRDQGLSDIVVQRANRASTVKGFLDSVEAIEKHAIINLLAREAIHNFRQWAPDAQVSLFAYDTDGKCIYRFP